MLVASCDGRVRGGGRGPKFGGFRFFSPFHGFPYRGIVTNPIARVKIICIIKLIRIPNKSWIGIISQELEPPGIKKVFQVHVFFWVNYLKLRVPLTRHFFTEMDYLAMKFPPNCWINIFFLLLKVAKRPDLLQSLVRGF